MRELAPGDRIQLHKFYAGSAWNIGGQKARIVKYAGEVMGARSYIAQFDNGAERRVTDDMFETLVEK